MSDSEINKFLREHEDFFWHGNKIKCASTGHEMPAKLEAVREYASGKKYAHARDWYAHDFSQYKAHFIVPGRQPRTMYCQVTRQTLNQIPAEIENHIQGRNYAAAKKQYEANIDRQRDVAAKRDAKARVAQERGWGANKPQKPVKPAQEEDDGEAPQLMKHFEDEKPQPQRKAWHEDLSDLYPDMGRNDASDDDEGDEEEDNDRIMAYMEEIAQSDAENGDGASDESEEDKKDKKKKKKDKSKSKRKNKDSDDEEASEEDRKKKDKKDKKKSKDHVSKHIEEDFKGKSKSMKDQRKDKKDKRDRKSKSKSEKSEK